MADVKPTSKRQDKQAQVARDIKDIGKTLEHARKEKGLTVEAVNKKTRIHIKILKGLEDGTIESTMGRVYIRGFLKKYADFLGVDVQDVLKVYSRANAKGESPQKLFIEPEEEGDIDWDKYSPLIFTGVATILVLGLIVFAGVKTAKIIAHKFNSNQSYVQKNVLPKKGQGFQGAVALNLKASEDVWVSLDKDGSNVFRGTLKKGSKESWSASGQIRLRVGKVEALDFTVNGKSLGKLGSGVEDITIEARNVRVGKKNIGI